MDSPRSFVLLVHGRPVGKARPRVVRGKNGVHSFTPRETEVAEGEVRRKWEEAGSPRLDGAVRLSVCVVVERPRGHFRANGSLNAEGERQRLPARQKPDIDNVLKLVMDSLNTRAWEDDVRVVEVSMVRTWGHPARMEVLAAEVR